MWGTHKCCIKVITVNTKRPDNWHCWCRPVRNHIEWYSWYSMVSKYKFVFAAGLCM